MKYKIAVIIPAMPHRVSRNYHCWSLEHEFQFIYSIINSNVRIILCVFFSYQYGTCITCIENCNSDFFFNDGAFQKCNLLIMLNNELNY